MVSLVKPGGKLLYKTYIVYSSYPASMGFLVPVYFVLAERGYTLELVGLLMLMYRLAYYSGDIFISVLADVAKRRTALFISSASVFTGVLGLMLHYMGVSHLVGR